MTGDGVRAPRPEVTKWLASLAPCFINPEVASVDFYTFSGKITATVTRDEYLEARTAHPSESTESTLTALRAALREAQQEMAINSSMLARQCDLAREAETKANAAEQQLTTLRGAVAQIVEEIDKQLDDLDRAAYTVDVREKFNSVNEVLATVVDRSTAMHMLLFVKKAVRDRLAQLGEGQP